MTALRSKEIQDYRTADIANLRSDRALPCDVYLYFEQNQHIILWQKKDYVFPPGAFEKYLSRGLKKVWVYKDDVKGFEEYLAPALIDPVELPTLEEKPAREGVDEDDFEAAPDEHIPDPSEVTEITARYLLTLLRSALYSDRQKRAMIAKAVRILLGKAAKPSTFEDQVIQNFKLQELVRELLSKINRDDRSLIHQVSRQIWKFGVTDPSLSHSLNVASYSILIAMSFGRIDEEMISEIGIAALLHDIGLSQLPMPAAQIAWKSMSTEQSASYQKHVPATLDLMSLFLTDVPSRILAMVEQVHECHDGHGYPHRKKGSEIHEVAQLISIADRLETISSGGWDGSTRTFNDSLGVLEASENQSLTSKPEVFSAIARWIREAREAA